MVLFGGKGSWEGVSGTIFENNSFHVEVNWPLAESTEEAVTREAMDHDIDQVGVRDTTRLVELSTATGYPRKSLRLVPSHLSRATS